MPYPPVASSDAFVLYAVPETAWNTLPTLTSVVRSLPLISMKGGTSVEWKASSRYRRDNQRSRSRAIRSSATAHVEFELRPEAWDDLLSAVLGSPLFEPGGLVGIADVYVDATTQSFVGPQEVDWYGIGVRIGMWVHTAGFWFAQNNGMFQIREITGSQISIVPAGLVAESADVTESRSLVVGFRFHHSRSGATRRTFFLEGHSPDVNLFEQYRGMQPTAFTLEWRPQSLVQGSMDFVGASMEVTTLSILDPAFLCPSRGGSLFDTASGILSMREGGDPLTVPLTGFAMTVENSAEPLARVSDLTPYGIRLGSIAVHGTLQAYFTSGALEQKFVAQTSTSIELHLQTVEGSRWILSLPCVQLMTDELTVEGRDRDIFQSFSWEATVDPVWDYTASLDSFVATSFTYLPFLTGAPAVEYFRLRDQNGSIWLFWIDAGGQLARGQTPFLLVDDTQVNVTTGTVPYWHQVTTDEVVGVGIAVGLGVEMQALDGWRYQLGVNTLGEYTVTQTTFVGTTPQVLEVLAFHDPSGITWYLWPNTLGDVVVSTSMVGEVDPEMVTLLTIGTPPDWQEVQDSAARTWYLLINAVGEVTVTDTSPLTGRFNWYLWPDTDGQLVIGETAPPLGTGLVVGLGHELWGVNRVRYRVAVTSDQEQLLRPLDTSWEDTSRAVYLWVDDVGQIQVSPRPLVYFPGQTAVPAYPGGIPTYYTLLDSITGITWYLTAITPRIEYFQIRDQTGVPWFFWVNEVQQLARSIVEPTFGTNASIDLTPATVPYWHEVIDELGITHYFYPTTQGQTSQDTVQPAIGTGLAVGLGQELHGETYDFYRLEILSSRQVSIQPISVALPRVDYMRLRDQTGALWYYWVGETDQLMFDSTVPVVPGTLSVSIDAGTVPSWHEIRDELGSSWYVYPDLDGTPLLDTTPPSLGIGRMVETGVSLRGVTAVVWRISVRSWGQIVLDPIVDVVASLPLQLTVSHTHPSGSGIDSGTGIDLINTTRMQYRLVISNGAPTLLVTGSVCGV